MNETETAEKATYIERDGQTYRVATCYVCGTESEHACYDGDYGPLWFYLDGTPCFEYELAHDADFEICPSCGYLADDIGEGDERIRKIVSSKDYQTQRKHPSSVWSLGALLVDPDDDNADEQRCYWHLWGVWGDSPDEGAIPRRHAAIEALGKLIESGHRYLDEAGRDYQVIADLHRCCGEFEQAAEWVKRALAGDCDERVRDVLGVEQGFIDAHDAERHGGWETPGGSEQPQLCDNHADDREIIF